MTVPKHKTALAAAVLEEVKKYYSTLYSGRSTLEAWNELKGAYIGNGTDLSVWGTRSPFNLLREQEIGVHVMESESVVHAFAMAVTVR